VARRLAGAASYLSSTAHKDVQVQTDRIRHSSGVGGQPAADLACEAAEATPQHHTSPKGTSVRSELHIKAPLLMTQCQAFTESRLG
jgi:hypothetical protein